MNKSLLARLDKHLAGRHDQKRHAGEEAAISQAPVDAAVPAQPSAPLTPAGSKKALQTIDNAIELTLSKIRGVPAEAVKYAEKNRLKRTENYLSIVSSPEFGLAASSGYMTQDAAITAARELGKKYSATELRQKADRIVAANKIIARREDVSMAVGAVVATIAGSLAPLAVGEAYRNYMSSVGHGMRYTVSDPKNPESYDIVEPSQAHKAAANRDVIMADTNLFKVLPIALLAGTAAQVSLRIRQKLAYHREATNKLAEYFQLGKELRHYEESKQADLLSQPTLVGKSAVQDYEDDDVISPGTTNYYLITATILLGQILKNRDFLVDTATKEDPGTGHVLALYLSAAKTLYESMSTRTDKTVRKAADTLVRYLKEAPADSLSIQTVDIPMDDRLQVIGNFSNSVIDGDYEKASDYLQAMNKTDRLLLSYILDKRIVRLPIFEHVPEFSYRILASRQFDAGIPEYVDDLDFELAQWRQRNY